MSKYKIMIIALIFVISTACLFFLDLNNGFSKSNFYFRDFFLTENLIERTPNPTSDNVLLDGVVDKKIVEDYVLILNMVIVVQDTSIIYTGDYEYWILDYTNEKLVGPFSKDEFDNFLTKHHLKKVHLQVPESYLNSCKINCEKIKFINQS